MSEAREYSVTWLGRPTLQFTRFLSDAARFEFGVSYSMKQPVTAIIAERFPATAELALTAALFAVALGDSAKLGREVAGFF